FRLELLGEAEAHRMHAVVDVVKLAPDQCGQFRSYAAAILPGRQSYARLEYMNIERVAIGRTRYGPISQVVAVHEVGHLLGLLHVLAQHPACRQDHSAPACYARSTREVRIPRAARLRWRPDAMAAGMEHNLWHARPWQRAIADYLQP